MKRGKKLSALFLALVMAFSLAVPAGAANWDDDLTGHIVILHTNDVHGAIDNYASVAALKDAYEAAGAQVLLMDAGDFSQGSTSVNVSEGATAVELMNMAGYDVATTGYHEFDFGSANLKTLMESAEFPILAADAFTAEGDLAMDGDNLTFQLGDVTVGVFGLATPETATKAHPAKLEGVTFLAEDELFACAQEQVDELTAAGCDYIICLGHLGIDAESTGNRSIDLLENVTGIDVFIDGHSHSTQSDIAEETNGTGMVGDTILTSTGTQLESVGVVDIAADGTIDASTLSMEDVNATEGFTPDQAIVDRVAEINDQIEEELGVVIGSSEVDLNGVKEEVRAGETNLGDFVADGIYTYFNEVEQLHCDIAIMNGGGIRSDEDAGYWTFKTCKQVSPFGNVACLMSVTGKQIQDALEFAARFAGAEGKENGGFLQVAGATYEIHTDIPNTVQTDDKNVWIGSATGTPRVQNVKIYDHANGTYVPLDENKTYALAGMNYTLRNLGDGFAMFDGATLIKDYVSEDYLVMSSYAAMFGGVDANGLPHLASANSPLADYPGYLLNYEDPYGAGRIQMIW